MLVFAIIISVIFSIICIFGASKLVKESLVLSPVNENKEYFPTQQIIATPTKILLKDPENVEESNTENEVLEDKNTIPPEIISEMEVIEKQVVQERGIEYSDTITRVIFTQEQLIDRVVNDFLEDYTEENAYQDVVVLNAFGLIGPNFDIYNFYKDVLTEQIAGFYDEETKEMVIVQDLSFNGIERLTYAHEFTHALQDQEFGISQGLNYNDDSCKDDSERCAAIQALLEGDATLSELTWFSNYATPQDQEDILSFYETYKSPVLDNSPSFFEKDFLFPYESGYDFVLYLYEHGGWDEIEKAYLSVPVSTEQILHPERYPTDKPSPVDLPSIETLLGEGWDLMEQGVMGEWYTYLILAHGINPVTWVADSTGKIAAEGWGGDSYMVYHDIEDNKTSMVLKTEWESREDAEEFLDAFIIYADSRFGVPIESTSNFYSWESITQTNLFKIDNNFTTWILAPEKSLAVTILTEISNKE